MTKKVTKIRNAFGNLIELNIASHKEIEALVSKLKNKFSTINAVDGIMLVGSYNEHYLDCCMDLDLRIFSDDKHAKDIVIQAYKQLGAKADTQTSFFSPLDEFSYMFGNICVETGIYSLAVAERIIENILTGHEADEGIIYTLQKSKISFDKQGQLFSFKQKLETIKYPNKLQDFCIKKYEAVSLKLLLHAFLRNDYASAHYWLYRVFLDTAKILFAKNKMFYPGGKRLLTFYIPKLKFCPPGFVNFWQNIFISGVHDWSDTYNKALDYMLQIKNDK